MSNLKIRISINDVDVGETVVTHDLTVEDGRLELTFGYLIRDLFPVVFDDSAWCEFLDGLIRCDDGAIRELHTLYMIWDGESPTSEWLRIIVDPSKCVHSGATHEEHRRARIQRICLASPFMQASELMNLSG